jgi:hypothetical protein
MQPVRVHYLQHVPFEGLGSIEPWLRAAGHGIGRTQLFAGEQLPSTYVQNPEQMLAQPERFDQINDLMAETLKALAAAPG